MPSGVAASPAAPARPPGLSAARGPPAAPRQSPASHLRGGAAPPTAASGASPGVGSARQGRKLRPERPGAGPGRPPSRGFRALRPATPDPRPRRAAPPGEAAAVAAALHAGVVLPLLPARAFQVTSPPGRDARGAQGRGRAGVEGSGRGGRRDARPPLPPAGSCGLGDAPRQPLCPLRRARPEPAGHADAKFQGRVAKHPLCSFLCLLTCRAEGRSGTMFSV